MPLYVILALVTVVTLGIGLSLWKYGVRKKPLRPGEPVPPTTPRQKLVWSLGMVLTVIGIASNAVALAIGPVSVVQPIYTLHVLFVMVIGTRYLGERLKLREWVAGLAMIVGAIFVVFGPQALDPVQADNLVGNATVESLIAGTVGPGEQFVVTDDGTLGTASLEVTAGDLVSRSPEGWVLVAPNREGFPRKGLRAVLSTTTPLQAPYAGAVEPGNVVEFKGDSLTGRDAFESVIGNEILSNDFHMGRVYVMFGISVFLVLLTIVLVKVLRSASVNEKLLGIVAGVFFGTTIICFKISILAAGGSEMEAEDLVGILNPWIALVVVTQVTGLLIINAAFKQGRASVIIPLKTTALTLYPVLGGIAIFGEPATLPKMIGVGCIVLGTLGMVTGSSPADAVGDAD